MRVDYSDCVDEDEVLGVLMGWWFEWLPQLVRYYVNDEKNLRNDMGVTPSVKMPYDVLYTHSEMWFGVFIVSRHPYILHHEMDHQRKNTQAGRCRNCK